jgi:hypothetical protein
MVAAAALAQWPCATTRVNNADFSGENTRSGGPAAAPVGNNQAAAECRTLFCGATLAEEI